MRSTFLPFGQPDYGPEEADAVAKVLKSRWTGAGPEVEAFEQEFAKYLGAKHVVAVSSCSMALNLVLPREAYNEYRMSSLTWVSAYETCERNDIPVVFSDIDSETFMPPDWAVDVQTAFGGSPCTGDVRVIDSAHGLHYNPKAVNCYSFYANKILSAGDGGAIACESATEANIYRKLRNHGLTSTAWDRYNKPQNKKTALAGFIVLGYKGAWNDIAASIARVQLRRQGEFFQRRKKVAEVYFNELPKGIVWQKGLEEDSHSKHLFVIKVPNRDVVLRRMKQEYNVGASLHYVPIHLLYGLRADLPNTLDYYKTALTLPISNSMTVDDAKDVVEALKAVL